MDFRYQSPQNATNSTLGAGAPVIDCHVHSAPEALMAQCAAGGNSAMLLEALR